jgi:hypothetical protein
MPNAEEFGVEKMCEEQKLNRPKFLGREQELPKS